MVLDESCAAKLRLAGETDKVGVPVEITNSLLTGISLFPALSTEKNFRRVVEEIVIGPV